MIIIIQNESILKLSKFIDIIPQGPHYILLYNENTEVLLKINKQSLFIINQIKNEPKKMNDIFVDLNITSYNEMQKVKQLMLYLYEKGMIEINDEKSDYKPNFKNKKNKISKEFIIPYINSITSTNIDYYSINKTYKFILALLLLAITFCLATNTIVKNKYILVYEDKNNLFLIIIIILINILFHELSHAYLVVKYGARVKYIGIGLLYYFIPNVYVKYTQAFKLNNYQKATISYVGPLVDSIFIWCSILNVHTGSIIDKKLAYTILIYQVVIFLFNCNLLIPSDLLKMIEQFFNIESIKTNSKKAFLNNFKKGGNQPNSNKNILLSVYFVLSTLYLIIMIIAIILNTIILLDGEL